MKREKLYQNAECDKGEESRRGLQVQKPSHMTYRYIKKWLFNSGTEEYLMINVNHMGIGDLNPCITQGC
jgi:hypothetical protein